MTYKSIAAMAQDQALTSRIMACAAQQKKPDFPNWVRNKIWIIVSSGSDWAAAWDYAIGTNVSNPGNNEGVITDQMILSIVQPMS